VIEGDLAKLKIGSDSELVQRLKRSLAYSHRLWQFYAACWDIYGSQVFALRSLAAAVPLGLTEADMRVLFEEHAIRLISNPATSNLHPDFLRWLAFLLDWQLILLKDGRYVITERGRQLLQFAASIGVSEQKAF
jgi:hypothetical protein